MDAQSVRRDIDKDRAVIAQLELEDQALNRQASASHSLSGLEFTRCPRCLQAIEIGRVSVGCCLLCGQPEPDTSSDPTVEAKRIRDQMKETQALLTDDLAQLDSITYEADEIRYRLARALELAEERSHQLPHPLVDEVADASRIAAESAARLRNIIAAQARWESHRRLSAEADEAREMAKHIAQQEAALKLRLEENNSKIADLSQVFNEILSSLRDPWYRDAHIDSVSFLPIVDGEEFEMLSVGGARKTLVNLAYHLANLSMSISEREVLRMPTMLIIDSPRKNVGEGSWDRNVVEAVYQRLRRLQDAFEEQGQGGDFQIIIADNEPPKSAYGWIRNIVALDYQRPFVPGVGHQGRNVETMGGESTVELT